jgi:hypothetical protein
MIGLLLLVIGLTPQHPGDIRQSPLKSADLLLKRI